MAEVNSFKALLKDLVFVFIIIHFNTYLRFTFIPLNIEIFLNNLYLALNLFRLEGLSGL
jgi:hypothetical protein